MAAAARNPCNMASDAGGWRSPTNLIPAMIKPPAAAMPSRIVEVSRIDAGSTVFSPGAEVISGFFAT
jgi:hypothetical protein